MCHHKLDETPFDPKNVEEGDLIYVDTSSQAFFFSVLDQIPNKFILISHLYPFTAFEKFKKHLDNPNLVAWFSKNSDGSHPKLHYLLNGVGRLPKDPDFDCFKGKFNPLRTNILFQSILISKSIGKKAFSKHELYFT